MAAAQQARPFPKLLPASCAALFLASCAALPPSLRPAAAPEAPQVSVANARVVVDTPTAAATAPKSETKLYPGTGNFINPAPTPPRNPPKPEEASLNFEALDVREVAKVILGDYLKRTYTVHPAVTGTVTFRTVRPLSMNDLLPTLEMLLRQNNAAVVEEEGVFKILPVTAVRGSVSPQLGGLGKPLPAGFSVVVFPLKYVGAREMQKLLEPFAADNTIRVDELRNLVIMAGSQRELRHLVDTIELFDVDWLSGYSVGLFPIKSADVKSLVTDFEKVVSAVPGASPLAGVVRVIPIERMNAILVVTTQPRYLDMARTWIERIDQAGGTSGGTRFFVYQVRNGKAENLAQLIGDLFATRRTTTTAPTLAPGSRPTEIRSTPFGQPQPAPQTTTTSVTPSATTFQIPGASGTTSGEVRVIADKDTNSLLILASPSDYEVIENAIRRLDVIPRQVLVEVLLAEVQLTDDISFGIDWFLRARNNTVGTINTGTLPITSGSNGSPPVDRESRLIANVPARAGLQLINLTGQEVRAVLNAFGQDSKAKILASPQIMVLDNQKAQIKVGQRISVQTASQSGVGTATGVLNSYQYLETGILLAVTPRINSGGLVTLELNQEVSSPGPVDTSSGNPNPPVNSRSAQTTVVVASGESVALGGLINETNNRTSRGVPLLSKIPILGAAFGSQGYSRVRTELVLMITPKIVSDTSQARDVTEELRQKLPALEGSIPKRKDPPPAAPSLPTPPPPPQGAAQPAPVTITVTPGAVPQPPIPAPAGSPPPLPTPRPAVPPPPAPSPAPGSVTPGVAPPGGSK